MEFLQGLAESFDDKGAPDEATTSPSRITDIASFAETILVIDRGWSLRPLPEPTPIILSAERYPSDPYGYKLAAVIGG